MSQTLYKNFRWGLDGSQQSMVVSDGRVLFRGPDVDDQGVAAVDLEGKWLLPSFIDAHCHILPMGLDLQKLNLGGLNSPEAVLDAVRDRHVAQPDGWLHAVHYDQNRFENGQHLSRHDLDKISTGRPILLRHVNGHASVANSFALEVAGISHESVNPEGGEFVRDAAGELSGVLFEAAHELVTAASPKPNLEEMVSAILAAGDRMSSMGIACTSDMMTGVFDLNLELQAYRLAAERGCKVRTRLYLQWKTVFGPRAVPFDYLVAGMDEDRCRIAGIKIFADGAIGSATAAIYGAYTGAKPSGRVINRFAKGVDSNLAGEEVSGQLMYNPSRLNEMIQTAHEAGYPVAVHSIGDYSTDLVMNAFEATGESKRHRIEHAMILSDTQIERMANLGLKCTFQPEFLACFGNSYLRQLGPERASKLKRARSVIDAGIPLSFNSDAPIVSGDPWVGIRAATKRPDEFDPSENCSMKEALSAYTVEAARSNGDSNMGTLEPGKLADFNVFEPTTFDL